MAVRGLSIEENMANTPRPDRFITRETEKDLPRSRIETDTLAFVKSVNSFWLWDGSKWVEAGALNKPKK